MQLFTFASASALRAPASAGATFAVVFGLFSSVLAQAQTPGNYDITPAPGFGTFGKVTGLAIGTAADRANAMVLQPDGKIVLAGSCAGAGNLDFCLARLNTDGSLDVNFDGPSNGGNGKFSIVIGPSDDDAKAVALQPDGKIVVAGSCYDNTAVRFCSARLNVNGSLDTSFVGPDGTGGGRFMLPVIGGAGNDLLSAMVIQPDGRILLVGTCQSGTNKDFCGMRLLGDGTLDTTFDGPAGNGDGKFMLPIGTGTLSDEATSVLVQPDSKIVFAGYCNNGTNRDFCVARTSRSGALDTTFTGPGGAYSGKFALPIGTGHDEAHAITLQPDGKLVLTGNCMGASFNQKCVARLLEDGDLDASFTGPTGATPGYFLLPVVGTGDYMRAIAIQPDGKIVVGGYCFGSSYEFCFARMNGEGQLDASFDGPGTPGNGYFLVNVTVNDDYLTGMALQPDGKIVATGYCSNGSNDDFCAVRLHGGPFGARQCSLDLDGDGVVTATTDMLVATRVALGLRGTAVTTGIVFPANAKRNSWATIRDFLVLQCGMSLS